MFNEIEHINISDFIDNCLKQAQDIAESAFTSYASPFVEFNFTMESFCTRHKISRNYSIHYTENCETDMYCKIRKAMEDSLLTINKLISDENGIIVSIFIHNYESEFQTICSIGKDDLVSFEDGINYV